MNGVAAAEELERLLGSTAGDGPAGFAAAVARDEHDVFPTELAATLRETGFHLNYLPEELGGGFTGFADSLTLVRTAARRDLNVMPATMFSITALTCLLLHGSAEQQQKAAAVLRRGGSIGFALSEADHGSDLLANTARLTPAADGGGWSLTGRKWMVGLGQRCELAYVAARTGERGPAAFSAVLLDLPDRDGAEGSGLDRGAPVRTTGMRGIDFAHLDFAGFPVPADALVGHTGQALEAAVRAQQIVRVMSTAGSLGCADTALRVTLDFAAGRAVGRTPLLQASYPRREVALASAALLAADAVALVAARGLHVAPETYSVWGCAAKHVVAEATEDLIGRLGGVLATRSVLRGEGPGAGMFQKVRRDAELVRVVDTSALANLRSFAGQLPALAKALTAPGAAGSGPAAADFAALRTVFALDAELPPYEPSRLDLNARGRDLATTGALAVAAELAAGTGERPGAAEAASWASRLAAALTELAEEAVGAGGQPAAGRPEPADLAERFAWLHAAGCCLLLWWANPDTPLYGDKPGSTGWLGACLAYLLCRAEGIDPRREAGALYPALDVTANLHAAHQLFSALPVRLAGSPGTPLPADGR
ncbi:acyl-CoA dehydrogenase family protein [Actinacidiphila sp. ITFR-21]|uniref:acyl-CoA dehydrogenase family protein n=1 Tax=Actinacidiphila sp. ITFR-21 TaxID=3075199 RepID=UPI00288B45D5|nr:acyl-CoA dehydrogenase family protein [Streptomyces sp. ITFR-21]WNI18910.1 acyl-CoA dehydrogenase family protein [Streptomyces sp. ITFR-21]